MLKFDIRKQPRIRGLNEKLVNKLVEEANEVREAYYNDEISGTDYIREILDVQQVLFAIYGTYAESNIFNIFERNMKAHNDKLATSHKDKYNLGSVQYSGYVAVTKPHEGLVADLEKEIKYLRDKIEALKQETSEKLEATEKRGEVKLAELEERNRELTRDKLQLELLLKEGKPKELAEKEEEIIKLKEELRKCENNFEWLRSVSSSDNKKLREELQYKDTYIEDTNKLNDRIIEENNRLRSDLKELEKEISQLRIENGEYRDIIGRIESYLQELKRQ